MKKFFTKALVVVMGISTVISVTSCSKGPEIPVSTYYEAKTSSEIIEKIDNIGEATLANEGLIEAIYVNYTNLTDEEQALVTNYEKLDDARNAVTQLYFPEKKTDQRFDRSKIQIGTYAVNNASEENVQWLNDAGINFICIPNESKEALDMYEKYGIGAFLRMKPYWNVWEVENNGVTLELISEDDLYNSYAEKFVDHPAIWGMDISDEPGAEAFQILGKRFKEAKELFPNQEIYINLFPIYASASQLKTETYEEYINQYMANINTDYISFDFYNIDINGQYKTKANYHLMRQVENLRIVANACRENERDLWVIMQAGYDGHRKQCHITVEQLNTQLYSSLAFGAQVINWACWEHCWFEENSNMIDLEGNRTPVYYNVAEVNANIHALSPVYMRYENTDAAFVGDTEHLCNGNMTAGTGTNINFFETDGNVFEQDMFKDIQVSSDSSTILAGSFEKREGTGDAILFTNLTAFLGDEDKWNEEEIDNIATISFKLKDINRRVIIYYPEKAYVLEPDKNGVYSFELENSEGVFITAEP